MPWAASDAGPSPTRVVPRLLPRSNLVSYVTVTQPDNMPPTQHNRALSHQQHEQDFRADQRQDDKPAPSALVLGHCRPTHARTDARCPVHVSAAGRLAENVSAAERCPVMLTSGR
jgi:hypothetical protein